VDPTDPVASQDPLVSINASLVGEGFASIDRKGCKYVNSYPGIVKKLEEAVKVAKRGRQGMFEFGDVEEDDD
jgi:staphylococcal nuclease domain-containing protein 1